VPDSLIGGIKNPTKIPKHLLITLLAIPSKAMDLLVALPLVADANDGSLLQDVVMGDGKLEACTPSQHHIG
jgi:hypothetical protein